MGSSTLEKDLPNEDTWQNWHKPVTESGIKDAAATKPLIVCLRISGGSGSTLCLPKTATNTTEMGAVVTVTAMVSVLESVHNCHRESSCSHSY